jgi:hypothetical protein
VLLPLLVENGVFDVAAYLLESAAVRARRRLPVRHDRRPAARGEVPEHHGRAAAVRHRPATSGFGARGVVSDGGVHDDAGGRRGGWSDPAVPLSRISVVRTVGAFGAALGDILPGESSARDVDDELDDTGERVGIGAEEGPL